MNLYWIGIDAHKVFCEIAVINSEGNIVSRINVPTNEAHLINAMIALKGERRVVVEESTLAQWLYVTLKPYVNEFIISDPKQNKWIYSGEEKNDKVDCFKLADLYRMGRIRKIYHTDVKGLEDLRKMVWHYDKITQGVTRIKNRIKSQYMFCGIMITGTAVYNSKKREKYLELIKSFPMRQILYNYYSQLDLYCTQKVRVIRILREMSRKYPIIRRFKTMPGIGFIRGVTIYAMLLTPYRFSNKSKLNRYSGLSVVEKKSAGKTYSRYASRSGNRLLKKVLMDAATSCISRVKLGYFTGRYNELLKKGLTEKAAKRTIAREILRIVVGIWKKEDNFLCQKHENNRKKMLTLQYA